MLADKRRTCEVSRSAARNSSEVWLFQLKYRQTENTQNEEGEKEEKTSLNKRPSALQSGKRVFRQGGRASGAEPQVGLPRPSAAAAAELPPARAEGARGSWAQNTESIAFPAPQSPPPTVIGDVL